MGYADTEEALDLALERFNRWYSDNCDDNSTVLTTDNCDAAPGRPLEMFGVERARMIIQMALSTDREQQQQNISRAMDESFEWSLLDPEDNVQVEDRADRARKIIRMAFMTDDPQKSEAAKEMDLTMESFESFMEGFERWRVLDELCTKFDQEEEEKYDDTPDAPRDFGAVMGAAEEEAPLTRCTLRERPGRWRLLTLLLIGFGWVAGPLKDSTGRGSLRGSLAK